jgi:eukaryotic-like serine/threonine-protein kinase
MSPSARGTTPPSSGLSVSPSPRVWKLLDKLGEGTLSEVWRAAHEPLGREVAVKLLKSSVAPGSQLGVRFDREAALLASMAHQNIPQVHDAGITPEGRPFIVMELVDGLSLGALTKKSPGEQLPCDVAAVIALKLARALEYVHLRGVIHRDCKPSNVLVSRRGEVKLADFGLAREAGETVSEGLGVVGTPAYMSPEQVLGDRLDFRSDLFSFGIVFYEMLTARRPFEEDPARTVMQKIRLDRYTRPRSVRSDVPAVLERVLGRCLEKNPAHRYPSTGALCDDLNEYLSRAGVSSHETRLIAHLREVGVLDHDGERRALGPMAQAWAKRPADRDPLKVIALGQVAAFIALVMGLGTAEFSLSRSPEPSPAVGPRPMGTPGVGYLRVLARPWAEISVDGVTVDTTPTARPVPLAPGSHFVRLRNPSCITEDRAIQVAAGTVVWIDVDLRPASEASR